MIDTGWVWTEVAERIAEERGLDERPAGTMVGPGWLSKNYNGTEYWPPKGWIDKGYVRKA